MSHACMSAKQAALYKKYLMTQLPLVRIDLSGQPDNAVVDKLLNKEKTDEV